MATHILSMTTFVLQWQNLVSVKETIWPRKSKIFSIWFFRENVFQLMSDILNIFFLSVKLFQLANKHSVIFLIKSDTSPDSLFLLQLLSHFSTSFYRKYPQKACTYPNCFHLFLSIFSWIHWRVCFNHFIQTALLRSSVMYVIPVSLANF